MRRAMGPGRFNRRTVLKGAASAAAAGSASAAWLAPLTVQAQNASPVTEAVSDRIQLLTGLGGNLLVHTDGPNTIVVDSGSAQHAETLTNWLETMMAGNSLTALFNTHWHREQVGGNAALRGLGAEIIAHEKTLAHLSIPYFLPDEDRYQEPLPADGHPTATFFTEGSLLSADSLSGRVSFDAGPPRISYGYLLEAHTDGDIYVHFEDENVIAAGDAISPERDPVFDWFGGGWIGGRIDSLQLLLERSDGDTRFVPSYGPVVDRAYVETELELMLGLYDILFDRVRAGESAEDIHASGALDALPRQFDDPARLLYDVHKSIWAHYNTISPDIV